MNGIYRLCSVTRWLDGILATPVWLTRLNIWAKASLLSLLLASCHSHADDSIVSCYVGSYTRTEGHVDGKSTGIARLDFDLMSGDLSEPEIIATLTNPSYITLTRDEQTLYAVEETGHPDGSESGQVVMLHRDAAGWSEVQRIDSDGLWPCHLALSPDETELAVANYGGGVSRYKIRKDGKLELADTISLPYIQSDHPRQESSHPHMVSYYDGHLLITDLGSNAVYEYEPSSTSISRSFVTGDATGPRHMVILHDLAQMVVLTELSNELLVYDLMATDSVIEPLQRLMVYAPGGADPSEIFQSSAIRLHPNGRMIYAAHRAKDTSARATMTLYRVIPGQGLIASGVKVLDGPTPRDIHTGPMGMYLVIAYQDSDRLQVYLTDPATMLPTELVSDITLATPASIAWGKMMMSEGH